MSRTDSEAIVELCRLVSRQYRLEVLSQLDAAGEQRFSELQRQLDVSSKVLTDALSDLTDANAAVRHVRSESPQHVEYALTNAGRELLTIVAHLDHWATEHRWRTVPTVLILDEHERCGELYADWLSPEYDVTRVSEYAQLNETQLEEASVVVFHYRGRAQGVRVDKRLAETDHRCIVVTPMRYDRTALEMRPAEHLVEPVLKEPLRGAVASILEAHPPAES